MAGATFGIWITKKDSQHSPFSPQGEAGGANPAAHCSLHKHDSHTAQRAHTHTHTQCSVYMYPHLPSPVSFTPIGTVSAESNASLNMWDSTFPQIEQLQGGIVTQGCFPHACAWQPAHSDKRVSRV